METHWQADQQKKKENYGYCRVGKLYLISNEVLINRYSTSVNDQATHFFLFLKDHDIGCLTTTNTT